MSADLSSGSAAQNGVGGLVLGELLRRNASFVPSKAAFIYCQQTDRVVVTYCQLNLVANSFANALRAAGIEKGRGGVPIPQQHRAGRRDGGAVKTGAIAMPLNFR